MTYNGHKYSSLSRCFIEKQEVLTNVNNTMVINEKASKMYKFFDIHFVRRTILQ